MNEMTERPWSEDATLDDIYYCYRLLLGREPGPDGLKYWSERLATEQFTCLKLAAYFCKSREYATSRRARGIKLVALEGFELYIFEYDWDIGEHIFLNKQYEPHVTTFLKQQLREGMTFVDVGANIGYFTLLAATRVGKSGKVVAVECNPRNCELIYMSLHRRGFDDVLVYPFAVSDGQRLMSLTAGFSNGVVSELTPNDAESVIVPAVTLDALLGHQGRIDILKMDIEGCEGKAWRGMQDIVRRDHPIILTEFFPALLKQYSDVEAEEFLHAIFAAGYTATIMSPEETESPAASSADIMAAWKRRCELVGESRASLDLGFCFRAV